MPGNVKFLYLRDYKDPGHVVTVARVLEDDEVLFAWALNKKNDYYDDEFDGRLRDIMSRQEFIELRKRWNVRKQEDQFCKRTGRLISTGRLKSSRACTLPYEKGKVSLRIVEFLAGAPVSEVGDNVSLIAQAQLTLWLAHENAGKSVGVAPSGAN